MKASAINRLMGAGFVGLALAGMAVFIGLATIVLMLGSVVHM
jgi:hypothetical protein